MYFDILKLQNELGLSCIEDYILYLINGDIKNKYILFYKSFVPAEKVFYEMLANNKSYSSIDFIERIQSTAKKIGMLGIDYYRGNFSELIMSDVFLMQISPDDVKKRFGVSLLRDDHYLLIRKLGGNKFEYLNDRPESTGILSVDELERMYLGKAIIITKKNLKLNYYEKILHAYKAIGVDYSRLEKSFPKEINIIQLRDSIGVLRIIARRMKAFWSRMFFVESIDNYIDFLDKHYLRLEYMRLRGKYDNEELKNKIKEISEMDQNNRKNILERIDKYMNNLEEKIKGAIGTLIEYDGVIENEQELRELGFDSLKNVELAMVLEEEFSVQFDDSLLQQENFRTVNRIKDLIMSCMED